MLAHIHDPSGDSEPTTDGAGTERLDLDDLFDVVRNERRRIALRYLAGADGEVRFGELVDHVAAAENDSELGAVDSGTRKAVYTSLYQSHLPKLADLGVVVHDRQSGPVAPGPHLDAVVAALDAVQDARGEGTSRTASDGLDAILAAMKS